MTKIGHWGSEKMIFHSPGQWSVAEGTDLLLANRVES